jgi:hypothetical protein
MWRRSSLIRPVAIALAVTAAAAVLFLFLISLGDSDLPPYDPPFPGERAAWFICGVMSWPLVLIALILDRDPPIVLWLPLTFLGGLFWAALTEAALRIRRTRKA